MAERGAKLKELLKENSAIEQSIVVSGGEVPRTIARLNSLIDETDQAFANGAQKPAQSTTTTKKPAAKSIGDMKQEKEKLKASITSTLQPKDKIKQEKGEFEPSGDSRIEADNGKRLKQLEKLKDLYRDLFKLRKKLAMLINIEPEED